MKIPRISSIPVSNANKIPCCRLRGYKLSLLITVQKVNGIKQKHFLYTQSMNPTDHISPKPILPLAVTSHLFLLPPKYRTVAASRPWGRLCQVQGRHGYKRRPTRLRVSHLSFLFSLFRLLPKRVHFQPWHELLGGI